MNHIDSGPNFTIKTARKGETWISYINVPNPNLRQILKSAYMLMDQNSMDLMHSFSTFKKISLEVF